MKRSNEMTTKTFYSLKGMLERLESNDSRKEDPMH